MPDLDLKPEDYRRAGAPRIISRKQALLFLLGALVAATFIGWPTEIGNRWLASFGQWPFLILAGAMITRLWPLFFLKDED